MTDKRRLVDDDMPSQDEQMDDVRAPQESEERDDKLSEDLQP
jgi:hypothetical protein